MESVKRGKCGYLIIPRGDSIITEIDWHRGDHIPRSPSGAHGGFYVARQLFRWQLVLPASMLSRGA